MVVLMALNILKRFQFWSHKVATTFHYQIEAIKLVFADEKNILPNISKCLKILQFQVDLSCMGNRKRAFVQNNELIFSFPLDKLTGLSNSLESLSKNRQGLPVKFTVYPKYKLKESYIKIG